MGTLLKNSYTIRTGSGRSFLIDVDYALDLGLKLSAVQRRVFNALYLAKEQTDSGWVSDSVVLRVGWGYGADEVSEAIVRVTVYRLRVSLRGTCWWVETAGGGMYRLVTVDAENPPVMLRKRKPASEPRALDVPRHRSPALDHPWRLRRKWTP